MTSAETHLHQAYVLAQERYAALGVNAEQALTQLAHTPLSLHCWQGDDVGGFEDPGRGLSGGILATGNYPGKARTPDELRADLDLAYRLIPGRHRLNLHAIYLEADKRVERNAIEPKHFARWVDWAKANQHGLDFNPTCFSHPLADSGFTLSHADQAVRDFWIEHCVASREIGAYFGKELGVPAVTSVWIPDGYKDTPADRAALRVLAFARRALPPRADSYTPEGIERNLTFLGLLAMMGPPRPEVEAAVQTCHAAGIRLVMITGDYGLTAESLARRVGLLTTPNPQILTGGEVEAMTEAELGAALGEDVIFARMAPEHKLRVVAALQARGEVVAVTGDGVNDAPALRKADIGIAMGVTGTDVAKEAADVILTDDNFAAIVSAVEEGRAVYDNLRKFVTYILASNVPEIAPFVLSALLKIPLALTVPQLLAIDLGTDLLPALALGTERPEPNVMRRRPRRRDQPVLDSSLFSRALWLGLIETALCYAGFFFVYTSQGYTDWLNLPRIDLLPVAERLATPAGQAYIFATTVFLAGVITAQMGNAFNCRTEKEKVHRLGWFSNRFLLLGIGFGFVLLGALIYVRPLAALFELLPLPVFYWGGLILYAPGLYGLDRIRKSIARRVDEARERQRQISEVQKTSEV